MGGLSVKKKEEMFLRKTAVFAGVFTDSSVAATEGVARCDGGVCEYDHLQS